jgi:hypothetical protein
VSEKKQEARERVLTKKDRVLETFERIKTEQSAEMEALRERTARLRALRLKTEAEARRANARKAARAGISRKSDG